jgi:hypothetical protein
VWLAAWLFPPKAYTVVALLWLVVWHALLPRNGSSGLTGLLDYQWYHTACDFSMAARYVRGGYFLVACALVIGGGVQWFRQSPRAARWSLGFGVGALVIGMCLGGYCRHPGLEIL